MNNLQITTGNALYLTMSPIVNAAAKDCDDEQIADASSSSQDIISQSVVSQIETIKLNNNRTYKGQILNGMMHGQGEIWEGENLVYKGGFVSNKYHGYGEECVINGKCKGVFRNGLLHGFGVMVIHNGPIIVGYFENGKQNGMGKQLHPDESILEGNFKDGFIEGTGTLTLDNGDAFECIYNAKDVSIVREISKGTGARKVHKTQLHDGSFYEGHLALGCAHGHGRRWSHDKERKYVYVGEHYFNSYHGTGELTQNDVFYKGQWNRGEFDGYGNLETTNGQNYKGQFKNDKKHGEGEETIQFNKIFPNNIYPQKFASYKGSFEDNLFHGNGIFSFDDGSSITCVFNKGLVTGNVIVTLKNGVTITEEAGPDGIFFEELLLEFINAPVEKSSFLKTRRENLQVKALERTQQQVKTALNNYRKMVEEIRLEIYNHIKTEEKETETKLSKNELKEKRKQENAEAERALEQKLQALGLMPENEKSKNKNISKGKAPAAKNNQHQVAKSPISNAGGSSSSSNAATNNAHSSTKTDFYFLTSREETSKCANRITRWKHSDPNQIRKFADKQNGSIVYKYAGRTDDEIKILRAHHFYPNLERMLGKNNENKYYTKTLHHDHTEYHMIAMLSMDEPIEPQFGDMHIAVNEKGIVYHKKFEPWFIHNLHEKENIKKRFLQGVNPDLLDSNATDSGETWESISSMAAEILPNDVVELTFKNENYKLSIYPLWRSGL